MENRALGKSIAILHRREQKYMISKMKELGIGYSGYNFLLYLEIHSGSSQKEMGEALAVDEALAVRTMKRLEETGFIIRKKSEKNGRCYEIHLTEKGAGTVPKLRTFLFQWWSQVTQCLTGEEKDILLSSLEKMAVQSEDVLKDIEEKKGV